MSLTMSEALAKRALLAAMRTVLVALCLSTSALASEESIEVGLAEVLPRTTHVLIVEPAKPATRKREIGFGPMQAFVHVLQRFVVKGSLKGDAPVGTTIEVFEAEHETHLEVHRRYVLDHVNKIPIYARYAPLPLPDAGTSTQQLVFLRKTDKRWEFVADGATEPLGNRSLVEAALKR